MIEPTTVSCRELVEWVTDYLDGQLSDADRAGLEAHLAECPGCREYVLQLRRTVQLTGQLGGEAVPEATLATLMSAFRARQVGP